MSVRNEENRMWAEAFTALVAFRPLALADIDRRHPDIVDPGLTVEGLVRRIAHTPETVAPRLVGGMVWDEACAVAAIAEHTSMTTEEVWEMLDDEAPALTHVYCEGCLAWCDDFITEDDDVGPSPTLCPECIAKGWTICACGEGLPPADEA